MIYTGRIKEQFEELSKLNSEYMAKAEAVRKSQDFTREYKARELKAIEEGYMKKAERIKEDAKKTLEAMRGKEEESIQLDDVKLFNALKLFELYGENIDRKLVKRIAADFVGRQASLQVLSNVMSKYGISQVFIEKYMYDPQEMYTDLYGMISENTKGLVPVKNKLDFQSTISDFEARNTAEVASIEIREPMKNVTMF